MKKKKELFEIDDSEERTAKAMDNPKVGDRFSEMYAFWMYIIGRDGNMITFMEANPPCTLPEDGLIGTLPLWKFKDRYAYGTIPGYSIRLIDRENDVADWEKHAKGRIKDIPQYNEEDDPRAKLAQAKKGCELALETLEKYEWIDMPDGHAILDIVQKLRSICAKTEEK